MGSGILENAVMADPTHPVPFRHRLAAWLIDALVGGLLIAPFLVAMWAVGDFDGNKFDLAAFYGFGIPGFVVVVGLLTYLDGPGGGSPGKRLLGIRWVDRGNGERLSWRRAALAYISMRWARARW